MWDIGVNSPASTYEQKSIFMSQLFTYKTADKNSGLFLYFSQILNTGVQRKKNYQ